MIFELVLVELTAHSTEQPVLTDLICHGKSLPPEEFPHHSMIYQAEKTMQQCQVKL